MRGSVLRHARSIEANESRSNFRTGWAVGWVVWSSNPCKLLKDLVGARRFELRTSWSRTRRSTRLSHAPNASTSHLRQLRLFYLNIPGGYSVKQECEDLFPPSLCKLALLAFVLK